MRYEATIIRANFHGNRRWGNRREVIQADDTRQAIEVAKVLLRRGERLERVQELTKAEEERFLENWIHKVTE